MVPQGSAGGFFNWTGCSKPIYTGTALAPAMAPKSKKRPQSLQHPLDTPASPRASTNTDMPSPADVATPGTTSSPMTPENAFRGRDRERSPLLRRRPEGTTPPTPPTPRSGSTQRQQRQALEQSQQALEGVRSIQVREEDCSDTIVVKLHGSNPLAILKLLSVTDDARMIRKIEFGHVNLAAHTLAHALPTAPWVLMSTENYNAHGEQPGFRIQRDFVKDLACMPFVTENGTCPFDMASEPTEPLVTTRQPFDSWTLLPDGRSVFLGFKGDPLDTSLIKDQLYSKFHRQFAGGNICLWAPCKCRTHWRQLLDDEVHAPDVTVELREVPRRAMRQGKGKGSQSSSQGSMRPPEPKGPPPSHVIRAMWTACEVPGPPPQRVLQLHARTTTSETRPISTTAETVLTSKAACGTLRYPQPQ